MNPKLYIALGIAGAFVFSILFFRTPSPDLAGLDRPTVKLGSMGAGKEKKAQSGPVNSRFKRNEDEKSKPIRRNNKVNRRANAKREKAARARSNTSKGVDGGSQSKATGIRGGSRKSGDKRTREDHLRKIEEAKKRHPEKAAAAARMNAPPPPPEYYEDEVYEEDMLIDGGDPGMEEMPMDEHALEMMENSGLVQ